MKRLTLSFSRKQIYFLAAAVPLAILLVATFSFGGLRKNQPQFAFTLQNTALVLTAKAEAMILSAHTAEIYAPSSLKVESLPVAVGAQVKAGDVLAVLDTEALAWEIRRAELNIQSAEANLTSEQRTLLNTVTGARNSQSAAAISLQTAQREYDMLFAQQGREAAVVAAQTNLDMAERMWQYNQALFTAGSLSQEALTQSQEGLDKARAAYEEAVRAAADSLSKARETLESAKVRYKSAQDTLQEATDRNTDIAVTSLELQRVALAEKEIRLREARITAPQAGVVTLVNAKVGTPASGLMFIIEDEGALIAEARVEESDVASIFPGAVCRIRPAGQAEEWTGLVTFVAPGAEREINGSYTAVTGDEVFFTVKADIANPTAALRMGMNADIEFIIQEQGACFAVPKTLIYRDRAQPYILIGKGGRVVELPVSLGLEADGMAEISGEGLKEGLGVYKR